MHYTTGCGLTLEILRAPHQDAGKLSLYLNSVEAGLTIGSDHPSFLGTQAYLGWTLWCQGRLDEAESYYRFAMDGFIRKPLSEIDAYTILWALACILRDGGAAHVARYEIAKYISSLEEQDIESEAPFCDRVENVAQKCFSLDMKDCF